MKKMNEIEDIIINTLPKNITEAIYIFGSFGTEYFDEDTSDIDIGWFTTQSIDWFDAMEYRDILEDKLQREVDLVVNERDNFNLTYNILSGTPIGNLSDEFLEWFDIFCDRAIEEVRYIESFRRERENIDK